MKYIVLLPFAVIVYLSYLLALPELELHYALQGAQAAQPGIAHIVMLGDSHTEVPNWPRLMKCQSIANMGVGGNTSAQMLERIPAVLKRHPQIVFLMAGTNDALAGIAPETTIANLETIRSELKQNGAALFVETPPPLRDRSTAAIADYADIKIPFAEGDLLNDGIHLRRHAYAKWRDAIMPLIAKFCS